MPKKVEGADDVTSPVALLNAMGIGPEPVEPVEALLNPVLRKLTWRLKRVLSKLGFNCEKIIRESSKSIAGKVSWTTKCCLKCYDFLAEPESRIGEY